MFDEIGEGAKNGHPSGRSYVICATPRSGSTLLERLLASTGRMGRPDEFFNPSDQLPLLLRSHQVATIRELIPILIREYSTPNGVFGFKAHFEQFVALRREVALDDFLPGLRYIHLARHDLLGQSISYVRAAQTGQWSVDEAVRQPPRFDAKQIEASMDTILARTAGWRKFFAMFGIEAWAVSHEELAASPSECCAKILQFCGVDGPPPPGFDAAGMKRQADDISEEWRRRAIDHWKRHRGT